METADVQTEITPENTQLKNVEGDVVAVEARKVQIATSDGKKKKAKNEDPLVAAGVPIDVTPKKRGRRKKMGQSQCTTPTKIAPLAATNIGNERKSPRGIKKKTPGIYKV